MGTFVAPSDYRKNDVMYEQVLCSSVCEGVSSGTALAYCILT